MNRIKRFLTTHAAASGSNLKMKKSDSTLKKNSIFQNSSKTPVKSISDNGFKINDVSIKGPAIVLNGQLYLWDVPQFGVGGPDDDVEPLQPGAFDNPSSPFYGWTLDMFHVFQVAENKPEILLIGTGGTIHQFPANIRKYLNNLGIQVDVLSSVISYEF